MSDMSVYLGDALINWLKGTSMPTEPTTVTLSLWDGDPDSGGTEVTGTNGLARQTLTLGSIAARAASNSGVIDFGTASGNVDVDYVQMHHNNSNDLAKKSFTVVNVLSGQKVTFDTGDFGLSY